MKIARPGFVSFAIIDPSKDAGEYGQYQKFVVAETGDYQHHIDSARENGFEIRYHYADIKNNEGGTIPVRLIITEIPPGHVQPFHVHKNCYEMTVIEEGEVSYVESDTLDKHDREAMKEAEQVLHEGDMVFDDEGKRHTIANFSSVYAKVITTQTPKPYSQDFAPDWQQ